MKIIIAHWTAGGHKANGLDKRAYNFLIEGDGTVVDGAFPPEANIPKGGSLQAGTYAAHTANANSYAIGVAVCAMADARWRPFSPGRAPITPAQVEALAGLVARLATRYGIPVARDRILTHAEVQPTLGIRQSGKWDITWLPGMAQPGDPVAVGDRLRAMIRDRMATGQPPEPKPAPPAPPAPQGWLARLMAAIFRRAKE